MSSRWPSLAIAGFLILVPPAWSPPPLDSVDLYLKPRLSWAMSELKTHHKAKDKDLEADISVILDFRKQPANAALFEEFFDEVEPALAVQGEALGAAWVESRKKRPFDDKKSITFADLSDQLKLMAKVRLISDPSEAVVSIGTKSLITPDFTFLKIGEKYEIKATKTGFDEKTEHFSPKNRKETVKLKLEKGKQ